MNKSNLSWRHQIIFFGIFFSSCSLFNNQANAKVDVDSDNIATFLGSNTLTQSAAYAATYVGSKLGDQKIDSTNSLLLNGTNGVLKSDYELVVGQTSQKNKLSLIDGASATSKTLSVGQSDANDNEISLSGAGSKLEASNSIEVGGIDSANNSFKIKKGATAVSANICIASGPNTSNNTISIKDAGSQLTSSGKLVVGSKGSNNKMTVSEGGAAQSKNAVIGQSKEAIGNELQITGTNSQFETKSLTVGKKGEGTFTLDQGANINISQKIDLAKNKGSQGSINIGKAGSADQGGTLAARTINVGKGQGSINFNQADQFTLNTAIHGGKDVLLNQQGSGQTILTQSNSYVGMNNISAGTLSLSNNATLGAIKNTTTIANGTLELGGTTQTQLIVSLLGNAIVKNGALKDTSIESIGDHNEIASSLKDSSSFYNNSGNSILSGKHNTYEGGTVIDNGTVTVAANSSLGSTKGTTAINNGGLDFSGGAQTQHSFSVNNGTMTNGTASADTFTSTGGTNNISANLADGSKKANFINKAGETKLSGNNSYSGKTDVQAGNIIGASQHAFGSSTVTLNGGDVTLKTNVAVSSFDWKSTKSTLGITSPHARLEATNLTIEDKDQTHYFKIHELDNKVHTVISTHETNSLEGLNFAIKDRKSDSYVLSQNVSGTKEMYQFKKDGTLEVGKHDEIDGNYKTKNLTMDPKSSLTMGREGNLDVTKNFVGNPNSTIIYYQNSVQTGPAIDVGKHASLNGQKVKIVFDQTPTLGEKINILSASSYDGSFGDIDLGTPLLRARRACVGDPLFLTIIALGSYTEAAANQNQYNVAFALNSFTNATTGDAAVVSTALDSLTSIADYQKAFDQISPALYSSFATMAFNNANALNNELIQRLGNLRVAGTGFTSVGLNESPIIDDNKKLDHSEKDVLIPSEDNRWSIFTDGNGVFANVNINNQLPGYSYESGGITVGANYKWNTNFSTGLYGGYQGAQSKQSGGNFICDNGSRFGAFGTYQQGGLFANALIGGDTHSYQVQRTIQFPGVNRTASSAPTAQELDTMIAAGYDVKCGNFTFGPLSSFQYTYLGVQPFTETGAQSLNLAVESQHANSLIYSLGPHAFYNWQVNKDLLFVPQINLAWQHEFLQNPYAINSTLEGGGGVFNYTTTTPIRDSLYTGVGFTALLFNKYDASFFYNASAANPDLVSQNFFVSLGMRF